MSSARFEQMLELTMGLMAASIGTSAVDRAVAVRMGAKGLSCEDAYWRLLQGSRAELQELIEAVVVPETWFFRDPQAFAAMARIGLEKRNSGRILRLLSLPCSTGEEAYTMAMALLDAGLPAGSFTVDAIDISARSLGLAQLGIYGRNSVRSRDLEFRDRYFAPAEQGNRFESYRIGDAARAPVHFAHGNILDPEFLAGRDPYDIIFCRNLLIYFDADTQTRAIGVLKRLLAPEGVLFAGHSETGLMPANGMVSARIPMAFAFTAATQAPAAAGRAQPPARAARPAPARPAGRPSAPRSPRVLASPPSRREPAAQPTPSGLSDLRYLADAGRLEEAAAGCERHIREHGPSTPALLLLALISDAWGQGEEAARHYRSALYLEPDNAEALGHLALLLRKQGDHAGARLLDDRMRRQAERRAG